MTAQESERLASGGSRHSRQASAVSTAMSDIPLATLTDSGSAAATRALLWRVGYVGLSFSLVFTGYNVAQAFVTSMFHQGGFGYLALGVIYGTFAVTSLVAPLITDRIDLLVGAGRSEQMTMVCGTAGYVLFILSLATGVKWMIVVGSVAKGLGSGVLWISQGVWLTKCVAAFQHSETAKGNTAAGNVVGMATGIFFTLYNLNGIVGNAVSLVLLSAGLSISRMIWTMAFVTAAGGAMLWMADTAPLTQSEQERHARHKCIRETSLLSALAARLRSLVRVANLRETRYLAPYFLCQGVNMAYSYGNYPTFIRFFTEEGAMLSGEMQNTAAVNISWGFLLYGVGSMLGSYGWGKLYDVAGAKLYPLLASHFSLVTGNFAVLILAVLLPVAYPASVFPCMVIVGFLFGGIDFLTNAIINNSISKNYAADDVPVAFALYRFCFCCGFAFASLLSASVPGVDQTADATSTAGEYAWLLIVALNVALMLVSVVMGTALERYANNAGRRPSTAAIMAFH